MRSPLPAIAVAVSFVDRINRTDLDGLSALMADDHSLKVFDEPALVGREANVAAWRGHFESFPDYVIYPRQIAEAGDVVAVLGHTSGSHLGLPDAEEAKLTLIWLARVADGVVLSWTLVEDTAEQRELFGFDEIR